MARRLDGRQSCTRAGHSKILQANSQPERTRIACNKRHLACFAQFCTTWCSDALAECMAVARCIAPYTEYNVLMRTCVGIARAGEVTGLVVAGWEGEECDQKETCQLERARRAVDQEVLQTDTRYIVPPSSDAAAALAGKMETLVKAQLRARGVAARLAEPLAGICTARNTLAVHRNSECGVPQQIARAPACAGRSTALLRCP